MWNITIRSSDREIVAHGNLIVHQTNDIEFQIAPKLKVVISFDEVQNVNASVSSSLETDVVRIKLTNIASGSSNTSPIKVGKSGELGIFMNFYIEKSGIPPQGKMSFQYTFFTSRSQTLDE